MTYTLFSLLILLLYYIDIKFFYFTKSKQRGTSMGFKELQKNLPVFSISVVTKITQLTARQIRYYEEKKLFTPKRTEGNTRLFSFNDIDKLLTIKDLLTKGFSLKAIDEIINEKEVSAETTQIRQIIHNDIFAGPSGLPRERSIGRGDLSRFYNNKKNKF